MYKYFTFNKYLKSLFNCKVYKVSVDAGFTCPNRDGLKSKKGCIFCDKYGASSRIHKKNLSIKNQILKNIEIRKNKYKAKKFIIYFQSFSNTYADVKTLKKLYDEAIFAHPDIVGISIATRSDCLDEEKVKLIATYRKFLPYVCIELGLQSIHNKTLSLINRKETLKDFFSAYKLIKKYNLHLCVHIILGLIKETKKEMMQTAIYLSKLKIDGIKLHPLIVLKNTPLEKLYKNNQLSLLSFEDYVKTANAFIKKLPKNCIIHRFFANAFPKDIIAPMWAKQKINTIISSTNHF